VSESWLLHVIFIDDSVANVNACAPCGMQGVLYKDAEQLEGVLKQLGLPL
jgi:FMN phosphatase YigB (HAD superfamily)